MSNQGVKTVQTCHVVSTGLEFIGKQGLAYRPGISAEMVGFKGIHLQTVTIPPGAFAKAHLHDGHETAIYILKGSTAMWYGEDLAQHLQVGPGDYLYIPAGMPHQPYNSSQDEPCLAVIARTDPHEQESVILLPALDRRKQENNGG